MKSRKSVGLAGCVTGVFVALGVMGAFACTKDKKSDDVGTTSVTNADVGLTAPQIMEVARMATAARVAEAHLARDRSMDPRVQTLAAAMLEEDPASDGKSFEIEKRLDFQRRETLTSANIKDEADTTMKDLWTQSGVELDRAYVNAAVMEEQRFLVLIDSRLLPAAKDADVRAYLNDLRALTVKHLTAAKIVQDQIEPS